MKKAYCSECGMFLSKFVYQVGGTILCLNCIKELVSNFKDYEVRLDNNRVERRLKNQNG